ncbi:aldehyde dehydrogenase [Mycobacterium sp. CBMA271]|uniref:aldehyde dehydrogenase family protein n=1 Tax=unclassified Mycobacteroides TaxID=2618759 RepID=UPI0012DEA572|nr:MULTISPECIES: aldehyde dehydrogenase family protein [unclassified Mycobacteroides]MUM19740.1 aldehyde dehydrogenase [Mycobacteroides sp. CBMA 326]MUM21104.1 aldehyde dehydrogenase [Mycobacteroides sp. CBMA 271]
MSVPHYPIYIDGEWVDTSGRFEIVNPATEELVATAAKGFVEHADRAVAAALAAHRDGEWRNTRPERRADLISRIVQGLNDEMDELVDLHVAENGVTVRQAIAFHVGYAISHLQYFADLARSYEFERSGPVLSYPTAAAGLVRREPIGVVAGIVPWNFPLLLAVWKLGPALAAGNCVVMKPDEKTPVTLLKLAEIAHRVGLPRGVLNVITGVGEEVGARLAAHRDVRKIAFTGSTAVGKIVSTLASENVKRVTLELGGKGPNVLLEDADLNQAVDAALFACCLYQGQACESGTRLLVPESLYEHVLDRLAVRAAAIRVGDPGDYDIDMGPVISAEQKQHIEHYIELALKEGARLVYGGRPLQGVEYERGFWVGPTVLADVDNSMTVAQQEVFGPVLSVIKYRTVQEAVEIANDTEYGLSAGVWTEDIDAGLDVAKRLEAGTVWINDWHMVNVCYPFGGYKQSGIGRELGPRALDEYTEEKFIHIDLSRKIENKVYDIVVPRDE